MEKIEWDEKFIIGHSEIDRQHKNLVSLLNEIIEKKQLFESAKVVADSLEELLELITVHFKTEEKLMAELQLTTFDDHKREHLTFVKTISDLSFAAFDDLISAPDEIIKSLKDLLEHHVLVADADLRKHFN